MKLIFSYIFLMFLAYSCSTKKGEQVKLDLSKDENVIAELNKSSEHQFTSDDVCIERPDSFKDLILVGYFAHDRGCTGNIVFYKGVESTVSEIYTTLLKDNGWANKVKREKLALNLVTDVLLKWVSPLFSEPKNFSQNSMYSFSPPMAIIEQNEVIVSTWVLEPAGMQPESSYYLFTAAFNDKGEMTRSEMTDRFSVNY